MGKKKIHLVMREIHNADYYSYEIVEKAFSDLKKACDYVGLRNECVEDEYGDGLLDSFYVKTMELI